MNDPIILAIDTSCDETAVAVTMGRRILSNVISSQVGIHQKYGGVYPALAKRAHQERIDGVVAEALKRGLITSKKLGIFENSTNNLPLSAVTVTQGPGLAIALEVGIQKAKEIANCQGLPLIGINHTEGHILSTLAQNSSANPKKEIVFPALALVVSGGNTQMVIVNEIGDYTLVGETLDDACGEALDKAARILKLGYPGGPIIERLSLSGKPIFPLKPALTDKNNLNFSYSGLKTAFLYLVESLNSIDFGKNINNLAASFQKAAFEQIVRKLSNAIDVYQPKSILCGGGVIANVHLRYLLRQNVSRRNIPILFPTNKNLYGDNAGMIGVTAYYKYLRGEFITPEELDRKPRNPLAVSE